MIKRKFKNFTYEISYIPHCIYNFFLCIRFPFMRARNVWTGKKVGFRYTYLDDIPAGWRKAFGIQLCKELKVELKKQPYDDSFRTYTTNDSKKPLFWRFMTMSNQFYFDQVKEKYGSLRLYPAGGCTKEVFDILKKYEKLSENVCIKCGKPATHMTTGWIMPMCDECDKRV